MPARKKSQQTIAQIDVALPLPVGKTYTYAVPRDWKTEVQVGCRVLVPVRNRDVTGFVVNVMLDRTGNDVKDIKDILDEKPLFDTVLLQLTRWIADYYLCPWGETLKAALPAGIHVESRQLVSLKEPYSQRMHQKAERIVVGGARIIQAIHEKGEIPVSQLQKVIEQGGLRMALKALEKKGYIDVWSRLARQRVQSLHETWVELGPSNVIDADDLQQMKRRAPRQEMCLRLLLQAEGHRLSATQLRREYGIDKRVLNRLKEANLIQLVQRERTRDPYGGMVFQKTPAVSLTPAQKDALRRITPAIHKGTFKVFLLHGVTGSGKTEVYIKSIQDVLKGGKQAIVLVPEISLTPQTVARFRGQFGDRIAVLHSRLSLGERYDMWRRIHEGDFQIVIGARSAVFAPVRRLGLIVVDEEHEGAYKQSDFHPRYHARSVAIMRAQLDRAVVILGSATPSVESYHNAMVNKYVKCSLPQRIDQRPLPPVTIVDMCQERRAGNKRLFSKLLRGKIADRIEKGEQIILLQNRRGFSSYVQCEQCGYVAKCRKCDVTLSYHATEGSLRCHYCDARHGAPSLCPKCDGHRIRYGGVGTQRIEKELQHLFPTLRVLRMDMDTTRKKGAHERVFRSFQQGKADLLLGTQMIAKGLDFPRVTLVGVIDADVGLNVPDFRACERTFQLLTQVAGRTGRSELGGEVVIQTFSPDHPAIILARTHDYLDFFQSEIKQRQELEYPPFSRLATVLLRGETENKVEQHAQYIVRALQTCVTRKKCKGYIRVLGPAPAPLTRIMGQYRWQVILKGEHPGVLHESIRRSLETTQRDQYAREISVSIDVDPFDML